MRTRMFRSVFFAAALALVWAGAVPAAQDGSTPDTGAAEQPGTDRYVPKHQFTDLLSMPVVNSQGQELGRISEVIIDQQGQVTHAILNSGGEAGTGDRYAVPWSRIEVSQERQHILIEVSADQLASEFAAFEEAPTSPAQQRDAPTTPSRQGPEERPVSPPGGL